MTIRSLLPTALALATSACGFEGSTLPGTPPRETVHTPCINAKSDGAEFTFTNQGANLRYISDMISWGTFLCSPSGL